MGIFDYLGFRKDRTYTKDQRQQKLKEQGYRCANPECRKRISRKTSQGDHGFPYSSGGSTTDLNHEQLCSECHKKKSENWAGVGNRQKRNHLSWQQNKRDLSKGKSSDILDLDNLGFSDIRDSGDSKSTKKKNRKNDPYGLGNFSL